MQQLTAYFTNIKKNLNFTKFNLEPTFAQAMVLEVSETRKGRI